MPRPAPSTQPTKPRVVKPKVLGKIANRSEHLEQVDLINWCRSHPDRRLALIYSHLNGMWAKNLGTAMKAKAAGAVTGIPDLFLPVAIGDYHGMYIELKKVGGAAPSPDQKRMLLALTEQGYYACVCKGAAVAQIEIQNYLDAIDSNLEN